MSERVKLTYLSDTIHLIRKEEFKVTGSVALFSFGIIDVIPTTLEIIVEDPQAIAKVLYADSFELVNIDSNRCTYTKRSSGNKVVRVVLIVLGNIYHKVKCKELLLHTTRYTKSQVVYPKEVVTLYLEHISDGVPNSKELIGEIFNYLHF